MEKELLYTEKIISLDEKETKELLDKAEEIKEFVFVPLDDEGKPKPKEGIPTVMCIVGDYLYIFCPDEVMEMMGWKAGDIIGFYETEGGMVIEKVEDPAVLSRLSEDVGGD